MKTLTAAAAASLALLASPGITHADPRTDVLKGTTEGITIFGQKKSPEPAAPATAPASSPAATPSAATKAASAPIATPVRRAAGSTPQWGDPAPGQAAAAVGNTAAVPSAPATATAKAPPPAPSATSTNADPRIAVLKGTSEGITIFGSKKNASPGAANAAEPAASSASLLESVRSMLKLDPPSGQSLPQVKNQAGSEGTGIPVPTGAVPGGK